MSLAECEITQDNEGFVFVCRRSITLIADCVLESQCTMLHGATNVLLCQYTYTHPVSGRDTGQRGVSEALACGCRVG